MFWGGPTGKPGALAKVALSISVAAAGPLVDPSTFRLLALVFLSFVSLLFFLTGNAYIDLKTTPDQTFEKLLDCSIAR